MFFFFSSRRRHTRSKRDWSSDVCSSDLKNQLVYTTHSPFLIDGEHLHRVRPVTEDKTGHSSINAETWPADRETIFPLQAAAGYAMVRGLFQHKNNVLVEGMSDYYYFHALSNQCRATNRKSLP